MDEAVGRLRAEAQRLSQGKPRTQVRYPVAFRWAAVALACVRLEQGGSVARLARELGVSDPTLAKWLRPGPALPVLRPVAVTLTASSEGGDVSRPVLITPNGLRVEGLDHDGLVAVLQALG